MAFVRQPRYFIVRHTPTGTSYYMNRFCEPTHRTGVFGAPWSNGEPGGFTLHRAKAVIEHANKELMALLPDGLVRLGTQAFRINELPGYLWHTESC